MKRNFLLGAAAAALAFGGHSASADTINVGLISSFSGPFAIYGEKMRCGVEAFQSIYGSSVNGTEVHVVYRDDTGANPNRARQVVQELVVRENIRFLTGFVFSPNVAAATPLAEEADVPILVASAIQPNLTQMSDLVVRLSYDVDQLAIPGARWAFENGLQSFTTMVSDFGPGHAIEESFVAEFERLGGQVVESIRIPLNTNDYSPYFEQVLSTQPDAIFMFVPGGPPSVSMVRTWAERGLRDAGIQLLATGQVEDADLAAIGDAAIGTVSPFIYTVGSEIPENVRMIEALEQVCGAGTIPEWTTLGAYDAMRVIYDTLEELGPDFTGADAVEFIRHHAFESPRGSVRLDPETRELVQNIYLHRVERLEDGSLANVDFDVIPDVGVSFD